jgi:hypothetical protein
MLYNYLAAVKVHLLDLTGFIYCCISSKNWGDISYLVSGMAPKHYIDTSSVASFYAYLLTRKISVYEQYRKHSEKFLNEASAEDMAVMAISDTQMVPARGGDVIDFINSGKEVIRITSAASLWEHDAELSRVYLAYSTIACRFDEMKLFLEHVGNKYIMSRPINSSHKPVAVSQILSCQVYFDQILNKEIENQAVQSARTWSKMFLEVENEAPTKFIYFACLLFHVKWEPSEEKVLFCLERIKGVEHDFATTFAATIGVPRLIHLLVFKFRFGTRRKPWQSLMIQ